MYGIEFGPSTEKLQLRLNFSGCIINLIKFNPIRINPNIKQ